MDVKIKAEEFFQTIVDKKKRFFDIPFNCSQGETGALFHLNFIKDGISATELSGILNVSLPRIATLLNSLESKKLVEKVIDNKDKRKSIIYITEIGKEKIIQIKEEAVKRLESIFEKLDEEEINQYINLSLKIGNIMEGIQV